MKNLKIEIWHGEYDTLYHVVDSAAPEEEQPAILYTAQSWHEAQCFICEIGGEA